MSFVLIITQMIFWFIYSSIDSYVFQSFGSFINFISKYFVFLVKLSLFTVPFCFLLCLFFLCIFNTSVSASLAQWLEHWSRRPGVASSNLSWDCRQFFFLSLLIATLISFFYLFIYSSIVRSFSSQFVRSLVYSAGNTFYFLTQVVPVYCSFLFRSNGRSLFVLSIERFAFDWCTNEILIYLFIYRFVRFSVIWFIH